MEAYEDPIMNRMELIECKYKEALESADVKELAIITQAAGFEAVRTLERYELAKNEVDLPVEKLAQIAEETITAYAYWTVLLQRLNDRYLISKALQESSCRRTKNVM